MHCLAAIKLQNLTAINLHFLIGVDRKIEEERSKGEINPRCEACLKARTVRSSQVCLSYHKAELVAEEIG